ncbi:hypothetical protein BC567DRAFT_20433 [Phyllosticta citribraziliensis]
MPKRSLMTQWRRNQWYKSLPARLFIPLIVLLQESRPPHIERHWYFARPSKLYKFCTFSWFVWLEDDGIGKSFRGHDDEYRDYCANARQHRNRIIKKVAADRRERGGSEYLLKSSAQEHSGSLSGIFPMVHKSTPSVLREADENARPHAIAPSMRHLIASRERALSSTLSFQPGKYKNRPPYS